MDRDERQGKGVDTLIQEGLDLYQSGLVEQAVAVWTQVLHMHPEEPRALELLRKAGVNTPADSAAPALELSGTRKELEALLADRRYEEALALLFEARRQNPQAEEISRGIQLLKQRLIRRYLRLIGNLDHIPQLSVTREALDARASSEDEREVMQLIDGISSFGDIVRGSRLGRFETFRLLSRLVGADVVTGTGQATADDDEDRENEGGLESSQDSGSFADAVTRGRASGARRATGGARVTPPPTIMAARRRAWPVAVAVFAIAAGGGFFVWGALGPRDIGTPLENRPAMTVSPPTPKVVSPGAASAVASTPPGPAGDNPSSGLEAVNAPAATTETPPAVAAVESSPTDPRKVVAPVEPSPPTTRRSDRSSSRGRSSRSSSSGTRAPAASARTVADPPTRTVAPEPAQGPAAAPPPVVETTPSAEPKEASAAPEPPPRPAAPTRLEADAAFSSLTVEGGLPRSAVERGMARIAPAFRACYVIAARRAQKNAASAVRITFIVDETGRAQSPEAGTATLPGLSDCVRDAIRPLRTLDVPDVGVVRVTGIVTFTPVGS